MDKSMTGDGAVVRSDSVILAFTVADFLNSYRGFSPYGDQVRTALHDLEATIRQQAAEIERLTRERDERFAEIKRAQSVIDELRAEHEAFEGLKLELEYERSANKAVAQHNGELEARAADLLKALERIRVEARRGLSQKFDWPVRACVAIEAIAAEAAKGDIGIPISAAKGETV